VMAIVRRYEVGDQAGCIVVMQSNVPKFFLDHEVSEYEQFLARDPAPYFVVDDELVGIAACGGYVVNPASGVASLTWGMVHRAHHRRGVGTLLLNARLTDLNADRRVGEVRLDTSQRSRTFFERFGFTTLRTVPDGYGPGLDRYDMRLALPARPNT
jgi:ribosomal protein S18 acetylase RimI-like enzyme